MKNVSLTSITPRAGRYKAKEMITKPGIIA